MPPGPADFDDDYTIDDKSYTSTNRHQINRLHTSKLSKNTGPDKRKYMDDYLSRIIVEPATKWNHRRNSEGIGLDTRATAKQQLSSGLRDYFSMEIDVPGNFTYNVGDLVWCDVPKYAATEIGTDGKVERDDVVDSLLTGRYLIQSLHHQIDMLEQKHTTSMTVVRNVFATDLPQAETFKASAHFRSQPIDVIGSGIDITTLVPLKNKNLKIPSPQISTVEDIAKSLNVDLSSTDLNVKDAANKSINAVLNSTSNRVLANKNLAKINNAILTRKTVVEKIAEKAKLALGGLNLSGLTGGGSLNPMAQDRVRSRIAGNVNKFVQASMVSFKQNLASARSFFKGFF